MKRIETWAVVALVGLIVAVYDLATGWTLHAGGLGAVVIFGLFGAGVALGVFELAAGIGDRKRISAHADGPRTVLAQAARGVRWSSLFAVALSVVLFANCAGGASTTGPVVQASGPQVDPSNFWPLTAWVMLPLLLALIIPAALATAAQRLSEARPEFALRLAQLSIMSMGLLVFAAVATTAVGFFLGVSECDVGTSAGACAAGASSLMNLFALGSLGLFLPYLGMVSSALRGVLRDRAADAQPRAT
jgi:hypothetical protein